MALQAVSKHTTPAFQQANTKAAIQANPAALVLTLPIMAGSAVISVCFWEMAYIQSNIHTVRVQDRNVCPNAAEDLSLRGRDHFQGRMACPYSNSCLGTAITH